VLAAQRRASKGEAPALELILRGPRSARAPQDEGAVSLAISPAAGAQVQLNAVLEFDRRLG
jgi:hypothetical protein